MDTTLDTIVKREVADYAGPALGSRTLFIEDTQRHIYAVIAIPEPPRNFGAQAFLIARIDGERVIIEEDRTDRPLVDALIRAGVPEAQIVLSYAPEQP